MSNGPGDDELEAIAKNLTIKVNYLPNYITIKGTSTNLEKAYFRLTSAPDPSDVRPEPILKKALKMLKKKWKNN